MNQTIMVTQIVRLSRTLRESKGVKKIRVETAFVLKLVESSFSLMNTRAFTQSEEEPIVKTEKS